MTLRRLLVGASLRRSGAAAADQRRLDSILASQAAESVKKRQEAQHEKPPTYAGAPDIPLSYRYIYPEFLPINDWRFQNRLMRKLERRDMLRRRAVLDIPEFYVGSIMRVSESDAHAPTRALRFVGLCIDRLGQGTRASFVLRNVIDGHGVEKLFNLYHPAIRSIEVLKLERRLDPELYYLRDAPHRYSYVPQDFEPIPHPHGAPVPLNSTVVEMNNTNFVNWSARWELGEYKGMVWRERLIDDRDARRQEFLDAEPWEDYDVIKRYRRAITTDIQEEVYKDVHEFVERNERKRQGRRGGSAESGGEATGSSR